MMKRKYEIRWYEYELTRPRRRKFWTRIGATLYAMYIGKKQSAKVFIYNIGIGKVIGIIK